MRTIFFAALLGLTACEGMGMGQTKVGHGELYRASDGRYDAFFQGIHDEQLAATTRSEERRTAHRPLVSALSLTPDASQDATLAAVRERVAKHSLGTAIEPAIDETARLEAARAGRLRVEAAHCEQLAQEGHAHQDEQKREWDNRAAEKADDKKTDKRVQLRRELAAAVDVAETCEKDSARDAKATDAFADAIARAVGKQVVRDAPQPAKEVPPPKKPEKPKAQDSVPKRPKPMDKPAGKPAPKPQQEEIFNP